MITYAIIGIVILGLIAAIVRAWNAPKTIEQQRLAAEAKAKADDQRRDDISKRIEERRAEQEKRRKEREEARQNRRNRS